MIHAYPSIWQIGHKAIQNLFDGEVVVQEKIDGSSVSFGIVDGELQARSKGQQLILDAPEKLFERAIEVIRTLDLCPEWVYRAEYLKSPKHNALAYSRIPKNHIILYDITSGTETYLPYEEVVAEGERLGLEVVPQFYRGEIKDMAMFQSFLGRESILGGTTIEGIVVKNYAIFTKEKKVAMGKYVRADFEETNKKNWRAENPTQGDIVEQLIERYRTPARWQKAVQHLTERGLLENSNRDIGLLMREVPTDIQKECEDEIKDLLFKHFWKHISRGVTREMADWYKQELLKSAFPEDTHTQLMGHDLAN